MTFSHFFHVPPVLFNFVAFIVTEAWKFYGDAIWWPLRTAFDVAVFNLLWIDLQ